MKTKAKNAYELLQEVRALILEVPERYNQDIALEHGEPGVEGSDGIIMPACGTIGCRAGWVAELVASRPKRLSNVWLYARKILGLTEEQAEGLFRPYIVAGDPGTVVHAHSGARGITKFLRRHRTQLLTKRIR